MSSEYVQLPGHVYLPMYPDTWSEKLYVQNGYTEKPEPGFREFHGPGGHHVGGYGYPIFHRVMTDEVAAELVALRLTKARLDWIGDPRNEFGYSIMPTGEVRIRNPRHNGIYTNLEAAIDGVRGSKQ